MGEASATCSRWRKSEGELVAFSFRCDLESATHLNEVSLQGIISHGTLVHSRSNDEG